MLLVLVRSRQHERTLGTLYDAMGAYCGGAVAGMAVEQTLAECGVLWTDRRYLAVDMSLDASEPAATMQNFGSQPRRRRASARVSYAFSLTQIEIFLQISANIYCITVCSKQFRDILKWKCRSMYVSILCLLTARD